MRWTQIADATGLACIRYKSARRDNPRIDTLALVASWAGLSLDAYVQVFDQAGQSLPPTGQKTEQPKERLQPGKQPQSYDVARFYTDLDRVREVRGLTWHGVWRTVPSTAVPLALSAFVTQQIALNFKACTALARWAGLEFSEYTL